MGRVTKRFVQTFKCYEKKNRGFHISSLHSRIYKSLVQNSSYIFTILYVCASIATFSFSNRFSSIFFSILLFLCGPNIFLPLPRGDQSGQVHLVGQDGQRVRVVGMVIVVRVVSLDDMQHSENIWSKPSNYPDKAKCHTFDFNTYRHKNNIVG